MRRTDFVIETSHELRTRLFTLGVVVVLAILGGIAAWAFSATGTDFSALLESALTGERASPGSLMLMAMLGGLFFMPIPLEAAYLVAAGAGSPPVMSALAVLGGIVIGHSISYLIGWKLSRFVSSLVSTKKLYSLRRKVQKYGAPAVFIVNLVPAPAPVLTFALGIARYNMLRLFTMMLLGNTIKYGVLAALFL